MAAESLQKINKAAFAEIRMHKKIALIILILLTVGMVCCLTGDINHMASSNSFDGSGLIVFGGVLIGIGAGMGFFAVICLFRDMYNSQTCDVQHSLPMSAVERYFSKLLALLYIHIIPLAVSGGISLLMTEAAVRTETPGFMMTLFAALIAIALFIDSVTLFCTCCCGALAESIYFSIICIGCFSLFPMFMWLRLVDEVLGIEIGGDIPVLLRVWTLSGLITEPEKPGLLWINCLISLALIFAVLFIYKKRDARSTGDPIAMPLFYEFIMVLGVFSIYSLAMYTSAMIYAIIFAMVVYLVIRIVVSRVKLGVKNVLVWLVKFAATSVAFTVIVGVLDITNCFGIVNRMPLSNLDGKFASVDLYYEEYTYNPEYDFDDYEYIDYEYATYDRDISYAMKEKPESKLTDAQARQLIDIVNKYAEREGKTFDGFLTRFVSNNYHNYLERDDHFLQTLSIDEPKVAYYDEYGNPVWRLDSVFIRRIYLTRDEIDQLSAELSELDFIQVNNYEYQIDDEVGYYID